MKSCLKMLLVAGAFAVSLVAFQDDALADTQLASWYGPGLEGNYTASGDIFEPYTEYTAASPYLPFGTKLLVTYGGYSVVVEETDRGPYTGGRESTSPRLRPMRSGSPTRASTMLTCRCSIRAFQRSHFSISACST